MGKRYFSDKIVEWYLENKRDLPWRETNDPYRIWLSEIILQQTRVNQGLPYYKKFLDRYPDIKALAEAKEEEVLRLWQGLGYYTRARNLRRCAIEVANSHNGLFPGTYEGLKNLHGIGDYTAAAIASFAFGEAVAVVDGNVFRVLSRVFGVEKDIGSSEGKKHFVGLANDLIDPNRPGLFNQAIMEFGALHCTPAKPLCESCIFTKSCVAHNKGLQHELPVKERIRAVRKRYFYYIVIREGQKLALKRREEKDIWHGLYDFYLVEKTRPTDAEKVLGENALSWLFTKQKEPAFISPFYKHVLTHQIILAKFIVIDALKKQPEKAEALRFYSQNRIKGLPKPVLISRFLTDFGIL